MQIHGRAGGDDAHHLAAHEFFARRGLLHLIADSDFVTGAQESGYVVFRGVIRDAAHGHRLIALAIARREGDLQFAGGHDGIFVEQFVEIAQAEKEQRVRIALFDCLILPHQRRGGFDHAGSGTSDALY